MSDRDTAMPDGESCPCVCHIGVYRNVHVNECGCLNEPATGASDE